MTTMTHDLLARARSGDHAAFDRLTTPHRRELQAHCYRMLGSYHDAEEVLQDTLLAAWQGLAAYEERASLRTWLYRIATHRCLNALRSARRRPLPWNVPGFEPPEPTRLTEVAWLEPYPDALLERSESISLAFITALQTLPPRQVAAVVLNALEYSVKDSAEVLGVSEDAAASALKRARATLRKRVAEPSGSSPAEEELVRKFVRAYEAADVGAVVALLTDDVFMAMPPIANEYLGPAAVGEFLSRMFAARTFELRATRANGQPAFGLYVRREGRLLGTGLMVIGLRGDRVASLLRFDRELLPVFGLPLEI